MSTQLPDHHKNKLFDAFIEYRNEADKFLFTGGAAGVGFCLLNLFDHENTSGHWQLFFGAVFFGLSCCLVGLVFLLNAELVKAAINASAIDTSECPEAKKIKWVDRLALGSFVVGVSFLLWAATTHLPCPNKGATEMTAKTPSNHQAKWNERGISGLPIPQANQKIEKGITGLPLPPPQPAPAPVVNPPPPPPPPSEKK